MKFYEIAALIASVANFVLAIFVLRQDHRSQLHRAYFVWGMGVALWNLAAYFLYQDISESTALVWAKLLQFGIIIAPLGLYEIGRSVAGARPKPIFLLTATVIHAIYALSLFSDLFVDSVRRIPHGYWAVPGPLFWAYPITYSALTGGALVHLIIAVRRVEGLQVIRIRALLAAILCIWVAGTNDLLPILGLDTYPFTNIRLYPLGNVAACIYMTIVAYSVLQHTLLDVHVAFSRRLAYFIRIAFIGLTGLCLLLVSATVFDSVFNPTSFFISLGVVILSAVVASILFPRLFGTGGETFERKLIGDKFEYQDRVRSFVERLSLHTDMQSLLSELHTLFLHTFKLESYVVVLRDETNRGFSIVRAYPDDVAQATPELRADAAVFRYFEEGVSEYLSCNRTYIRLHASVLERDARREMQEFNAEFCFALQSQNEAIGLLVVGRKANGEPFTANDINLLVGMTKDMSMVTNQIRLKGQILQTQELDLLGRMSRGMAHDLNNLLTPVSTLLQLASETGECDAELLPTALRNVTTMRAYIKESLFFSEHSVPDLRLGRLDLVVQQTVEVARSTRRKAVDIVAKTPNEVLAEINEVLIQRLLTNIISNAIDASVAGTNIQVTLETLPHSESNREWLRIQVTDQGEGISKENLDRVQIPYFTTKNRGDETRGFGLGLAICRKIVTLHGGRISIESQVRRGTTVQVDLPSRQNSADRLSLVTLPTSA